MDYSTGFVILLFCSSSLFCLPGGTIGGSLQFENKAQSTDIDLILRFTQPGCYFAVGQCKDILYNPSQVKTKFLACCHLAKAAAGMWAPLSRVDDMMPGFL